MSEKFPCPCCGFKTLHEPPPGTFEICPVCFWEDDFAQYENPDMRGGANRESLNEARQNFKRFGAISFEAKQHVRPPLECESPGE